MHSRSVIFPIGRIRQSSWKGVPSVRNTPVESPRIIGRFVRERRQASHLTQQELGELAGVGTRFVSDLERGKATLRMDTVNKVLRVFGRMLGQVEAPREEEGN